MFRDVINEKRKATGLSIKAMADKSELGLPEETISRFLTKQHDCRMSTFFDICKIVDIEPYEAFMELSTANEFKLFREIAEQQKNISMDNAMYIARIDQLEKANLALDAEITHARELISHKDEIIKLLNELLSALKNNYIKGE